MKSRSLGLSFGLMSGEDVETTEGLENGPCVRMCAAEKTVIGDLKCPGAVAFDCDVPNTRRYQRPTIKP